jgi:hypothetical protein
VGPYFSWEAWFYCFLGCNNFEFELTPTMWLLSLMTKVCLFWDFPSVQVSQRGFFTPAGSTSHLPLLKGLRYHIGSALTSAEVISTVSQLFVLCLQSSRWRPCEKYSCSHPGPFSKQLPFSFLLVRLRFELRPLHLHSRYSAWTTPPADNFWFCRIILGNFSHFSRLEVSYMFCQLRDAASLLEI